MRGLSFNPQGLGMRFFIPFAVFLTMAGAAAAQAPIEYAGQGAAPRPAAIEVAALPDRLAGADDASYGYGRVQARGEGVIDLRRPVAEASAPRQQAPSVTLGEEGAEPWLERERVGPPYEANGRWYVPTPEPGYEEVGEASWYGPGFHGQRAANDDVYDQEAMTAAHPTLPLNSLVQVTNLANGREIIVRITDRGPYVGERLIDVSRAGAAVLGFEREGRARVHVRYLGPAPRRVNADGQHPLPSPPPAAAAQALAGGPMPLTPARAAPEPETVWTASPAPVSSAAYAAPYGAYVVQVGAFSDPGNAQRVRASAEAAGPVEIDVRRSAAGTELFRVRVGPFASASEAEAARRTLAGMGYAEAVVAQR